MIKFIIIGAGWRSEFYLRIAQALPEKFEASAICIRNSDRANCIKHKYNVKTVSSVEEALKVPFDFIVNCVNKDDISDFSVMLADKGYYVLSETPVTKEPVGVHNYDKIQIAEQFHLKGTYQALKNIINSGIIGNIVHINISMAHDYHAMSIVRFLLDDFNIPKIQGAFSLNDSIMTTNGRNGRISCNQIIDTCQDVKIFQFANASVLYDYNAEQYFSPIRKDRLLIRGTRGEIENNQVRYLNVNNEFVCSEIKYIVSGLLDGFYNDKIVFENKTLYDYPFKHARLSEEEIAIAECLIGMDRYINSKEVLYDYEKAFEDFEYFSQQI